MKLPFIPSVNKINGKYYVVPMKAETTYRTIIKCDEHTAQVVNLLSCNISETRMITQAKEILPDLSLDEIVSLVKKVRVALGSHRFKEKNLEVIEI